MKLVLLLAVLVAGVACCRPPQEQDLTVQVDLQRGTVASLSCPLKTKRVTWVELEGGQKAIGWDRRLIFANVQGSQNQLYRCQSGKLSALVNVTVSDGPPRGAAQGTISHCQHGKLCAVACPSDEDEDSVGRWPGLVLENELWWGEQWRDGGAQGENLTMISPGVMTADRMRNPSVAMCRKRYRVTAEGSAAAGIPAGSVLEGPTKRVRMLIERPYSRLIRPTCKHLSRTTVIPVVTGQRAEIQCEGIAWDEFDEVYWLKSSCRQDGGCDREFVGKKSSRLFERVNANTTLVESAVGYPLSNTLVLDPVMESDIQGAFFCKLDSTGPHDIVTVLLEDKGPMEKALRADLRKRRGCKKEKRGKAQGKAQEAVTRGPR